MQPEAAPPVVHAVIAEEVEEQHLVSQLPLAQVPSLLQVAPLPILAKQLPPLRK